MSVTALPVPHVLVEPLLLGIKWLDPNWLLSEFGGAFLWVSLVIVFVECGLFFPFLPGDTLLFALGLFIAGGKYQVLGAREVVDAHQRDPLPVEVRRQRLDVLVVPHVLVAVGHHRSAPVPAPCLLYTSDAADE